MRAIVLVGGSLDLGPLDLAGMSLDRAGILNGQRSPCRSSWKDGRVERFTSD